MNTQHSPGIYTKLQRQFEELKREHADETWSLEVARDRALARVIELEQHIVARDTARAVEAKEKLDSDERIRTLSTELETLVEQRISLINAINNNS